MFLRLELFVSRQVNLISVSLYQRLICKYWHIEEISHSRLAHNDRSCPVTLTEVYPKNFFRFLQLCPNCYMISHISYMYIMMHGPRGGRSRGEYTGRWRKKQIMISETYVEHLVARKSPFAIRFLKTLLIMLAVCFGLVGFGLLYIPAFLLAVASGVGAYFAYMNADIEYEYLYLDKEINIDKVLAKSKRKKAAVYDVERMEVLAPVKSYHLDAYRNREMKTVDYSSGSAEEDKKYMMVYEGNLKIILEPSAEMVRAIQMVAPRKVFSD